VNTDIRFRRPADNPFAGRRIESLAFRSPDFSWRRLEDRLDSLGRRCAIVGPKGSGKTTLLEAIARRLDGPVAMIRIPGGCAHPWRSVRGQLPHPVTDGHAVLVDGCEQLGAIGWRLLLRATRPARYLVATLHRNGVLPTLIECSTNPNLLRELVFELAPAETANLEPVFDTLFHHHDRNIRLCFRDLYDVFSGRDSRLCP